MGVDLLLSVLPDSELLLLHVGTEAQRPLIFPKRMKVWFLSTRAEQSI